MVGGNYKCSICGISLKNVKLPNYDEKKDLILHYELCYVPNSENYVGCRTQNLSIKDEDGMMEENWIIVYGYKVESPSTKKEVKLTGCNRFCEKGQYTWKVDLKGKTYDPNKDLFTCSNCCHQHKNCSKIKVLGEEEIFGYKEDIYLIKPNQRKPQSPPNTKNCEKCQKQQATGTLDIQGWKKWTVCQECCQELQNCSKCKKNKATNLIEEAKEKKQVCADCANDKSKPIDIPKPIPNKDPIPDKKDHKPKPDEVCERCRSSCIVHKTKTSYTIKRKRYIKHKVDFTRESSQWFGLNCGCIEKFKQENQGTCPQCKKTEFPDMAKGWMLDYEIKKAFCSPKCHVTYRELKWEQAQRLTRVEMFPPELDVETNPNQNTDWEKEGLRREVLFWREYAQSLEQRLNNQSNLTPQERLQANYLRNLQRNTLRNAESNYQSRYGSLSENPNKGKGLSGGVIALLVIGGIALVGMVVALLIRNKSKK